VSETGRYQFDPDQLAEIAVALGLELAADASAPQAA
jgi:hypothetical protein